ncbi:MAG: type II secretion system F family protein [Lachnospiraceae bacterium]|nr:type II secretion system F family protein [Lachnospiraceae bacterium]
MPTYTYSLLTKEGKTKRGNIEATDKNMAMSQLKSDGATVLEIAEASSFNKDININIGGKVKSRDLSVFCRQFTSIIKAGVSVITALSMLGDQTENKKMKKAIYNVRDNVQKGETLSNSMKKEKEVFPTMLVNMIEAGEVSGSLETSLERMALHFEKDAKLKGLVTKALMYPMVLMVVAIGVLVIMCLFVVPNFVSVFEDMGMDLPFMTRMVIWISDMVATRWYIILAVVIVIAVVVKFIKDSNSGSKAFIQIMMKLPVIGSLVQKTACARFARTLSTLLAAGMPLIDAISITARAVDNVLYKEELEEAAIQVQKGLVLSNILKKNNLFPPMILHMLAIGEETGNMEEMLTNAANYYDEEVETATGQVMALMEPAIIVVMAGMVGIIIAAIYGPVLQLTTSIG